MMADGNAIIPSGCRLLASALQISSTTLCISDSKALERKRVPFHDHHGPVVGHAAGGSANEKCPGRGWGQPPGLGIVLERPSLKKSGAPTIMRLTVCGMRKATPARPMASAKWAKTNVNSARNVSKGTRHEEPLSDRCRRQHSREDRGRGSRGLGCVHGGGFAERPSPLGQLLTHGPVVKATTTTTVAGSGQSAAR